jgi:hypothetical protein
LQAEFSQTQVLDHPVIGHAFIEHIPNTHRYRITAKGLRTTIFYMHVYNRSMRSGLAVISPHAVNVNLPLPDVPLKLPSKPGTIRKKSWPKNLT